MKVSNQERFAFGIVEVAVMVRDTLEYFVPNQNGYDVNRYNSRKQVLTQLTGERSPIYSFCSQNGLGNVKDEKGNEVPARGQRVLNTINDFVSTVYGDDPRFIRIVDGKIEVDPSYFVPVLEQIIGVRETLNDIIEVVVRSISTNQPDELDSVFSQMVAAEQRLSRAIALRVTAMQLNTTFLRFQNDVRRYLQDLRTSTTTDPTKDPDFKVTNDPTVAYDNSEMGKLFGYMNFLIGHSRETDDEFKNACEEMRTKSRSFIGDPKITDLQAFMREFASIFIPIIRSSSQALTPLFQDVFNSIRDYEMAHVSAAGNQGSAPAATPTTDVDKLSEALSSATPAADDSVHATEDLPSEESK